MAHIVTVLTPAWWKHPQDDMFLVTNQSKHRNKNHLEQCSTVHNQSSLKYMQIFRQSFGYFCPILTKTGMWWRVVVHTPPVLWRRKGWTDMKVIMFFRSRLVPLSSLDTTLSQFYPPRTLTNFTYHHSTVCLSSLTTLIRFVSPRPNYKPNQTVI